MILTDVLLNFIVSVSQQAIGNVAEQLAQDIENNNSENGVWTKAAKELRFPCVFNHFPTCDPAIYISYYPQILGLGREGCGRERPSSCSVRRQSGDNGRWEPNANR